MSRAFRLGVLIVGGLVILGVGVFLIGNKRFLFGSTYRLTAQFENVAGLVAGADVRVGGIHAGTVSEIDLPQQPGGQVTVVMKMEKKTRNIVRKDSAATIETEGLLGDKYVEVSYGSARAEAVANGDAIEGRMPPNLEEEANQAAAEANKTLGQVGSAVSTFQDDAEALKHNFLLRGFFKKRGYYDESNLNEYQIARLPEGAPQKRFTYDMNRMFGTSNGAELKDRKTLNEAGKFLQENHFAIAVVSTPSEGNQTTEQRLETEARARAVRDYLAQQFKLDDGKLKTYSADARATASSSASSSRGKEAGAGGTLQILVYDRESGSARQEQNASGG